VGEEKVGSLKTLAIKLETLYTAWSAGALSLSYLVATLQSSRNYLAEAELGLVEPPWRATWDRNLKTYTFSNSLTGENQTPAEAVTPTPASVSPASTPPPPLPTSDQPERPPPPSAPAPTPAAQPSLGYGDMEIEEEESGMIPEDEEMANFYSTLEQEEPAGPVIPPPSPPLQPWAERDPARSSPALAPCTAFASPSSSGPGSPVAPIENKPSKKRKKVKVSNNIALKKKGVGDMLAKWQKINS